MSLEGPQIAAIMSIISEENTTAQTFETISSSFHQFFTKNDFFKVGSALVTLLQNRELIPHVTQRIVAIFLLYDMYRSDQVAANPFAPVFIHLLNPPTQSIKEYHWSLPRITPQERFFISQLITAPSKEMLKRTAVQILQMDTSALYNIDISGLQVSIVEKQSEMPFMSKIGLPVILSDMEISRYGFDNYQPEQLTTLQKETINALVGGPDAPYKQCMKPEFIRLAPPLHSPDDELIWLNASEYTPEIQWDTSLDACYSAIAEVKSLMAKAFKAQLTAAQQQQFNAALLNDPSLVHHTGLTPSKLPLLVENNPSIAIEILMKLIQSTQISEYVRVLINMEMSVHSMEVVNRLTTAFDLPTEYLLFYVTNCITTCENIKDKSLQNRSIRLLCVFLQSLIRNKILDVKDLIYEVQPFCIEYSRISEANALYRLLKHMENDASALTTPNTPQAANTPVPSGESPSTEQ